MNMLILLVLKRTGVLNLITKEKSAPSRLLVFY